MTKVSFEKIKTTPELSNGSRYKTTFFCTQCVTKINCLICISQYQLSFRMPYLIINPHSECYISVSTLIQNVISQYQLSFRMLYLSINSHSECYISITTLIPNAISQYQLSLSIFQPEGQEWDYCFCQCHVFVHSCVRLFDTLWFPNSHS